MPNNFITRSDLEECFHIDAKVGSIVWKPGRGKGKSGKEAGTLLKDGYRSIYVNGRFYLAHRLIWLYVHGEWPVAQLDHINRNKDDNSIGNLRAAESWQNAQNRTNPRKKSGMTGVYAHRSGKFVARIYLKKKSHTIGLFKSELEAHQAYLVARDQMHQFAEKHNILCLEP